jgi:hypothetical protein
MTTFTLKQQLFGENSFFQTLYWPHSRLLGGLDRSPPRLLSRSHLSPCGAADVAFLHSRSFSASTTSRCTISYNRFFCGALKRRDSGVQLVSFGDEEGNDVISGH